MKLQNVLNKRNGTPSDAVYVGRPTKWGNPFVIGRDGTREEVIAKYEDMLLESPELLDGLSELTGKRLVCWCAPLACHADVLMHYANRTDGEEGWTRR